MRPTLLIGRRQAADGLHEERASAFFLDVPSDADREAISALDLAETAPPSRLSRGANALWKAGLRLPQISEVLQLAYGTSQMQRIVRAFDLLEPVVFRFLDAGTIGWGHARLLMGVPADRQEDLVRGVVADRLSVARLEQRIRDRMSPPQSADHSKYVRDLQQALQVDDVDLVADGSGGYKLVLRWSIIAALQQAMGKIARAPHVDSDLPVKLREVQIHLLSLDELDAFCGHLVVSE